MGQRGGGIWIRVGNNTIECLRGGVHLDRDQRKVGPGAFTCVLGVGAIPGGTSRNLSPEESPEVQQLRTPFVPENPTEAA